jgi:hypothetical protein
MSTSQKIIEILQEQGQQNAKAQADPQQQLNFYQAKPSNY